MAYPYPMQHRQPYNIFNPVGVSPYELKLKTASFSTYPKNLFPSIHPTVKFFHAPAPWIEPCFAVLTAFSVCSSLM